MMVEAILAIAILAIGTLLAKAGYLDFLDHEYDPDYEGDCSKFE